MRCLVVYSSITGNTRAVAQAIHRIMPVKTPLVPVQEAPSPDGYDFIALGFWVNRAQPDPAMQRYMQTIQGKQVAIFGTLAAYPDSDHALKTLEAAQALLAGNTVLEAFLCLGKLEQKRLAKRLAAGESGGHPLTAQRRERLLEGMHHPDEQDFAAARDVFARALEKARTNHWE